MANKPVITGSRDAKRFQVVKGEPDTRAIRCTKCKNVARQVPDGKGGHKYHCDNCQTTFQHTTI